MVQKIIRLFILSLIALAFMSPSTAMAAMKKKAAEPRMSAKKIETRLALRDLWVDHIFWVRNVVIATKAGDADAAKVADENVVKNAKQIADSIAPYYGQKASDKLFELLAGHYGAIKDYMNASFKNDSQEKKAATDKLKNNAEEIATFLSGANPNWPKKTLVSLLLAHGGHHMAQTDAIASKDYASEAKIWEDMKKHIYVIADALTSGIIKQFPKKF